MRVVGGCRFFGVIGDIKGENQWGLLGVVGFLESLGTLKVKSVGVVGFLECLGPKKVKISEGCWGLYVFWSLWSLKKWKLE